MVAGQLRGDHLRDVQQASYLLHRMAERQQAYYTACAAEFELTAAQAKVLMTLQPGEAAPMRALAERLGTDPSNLTGLIDKLEARNTIRRVPDAVDRRVKTLQLTEDGLALRQAFWQRLTHDAGPIAALTPEQVRQLRDLLAAALDPPDSDRSPDGFAPAPPRPVGR